MFQAHVIFSYVNIVITNVCKLCDLQHIFRTAFVFIQCLFHDASFCTSNK